MRSSDRGRDRRARPLAVRLTAKQEAALFEELGAKRDNGALRHLLRGGRVLAGDRDELALAAYHLERSLAAARVVRNERTERRARFLTGALARLARAGIEPLAPERAPSAGTQGLGLLTIAPEAQTFPTLPKPLHPSKRRRTRFDVQEMRRGSSEGARDACRRAWGKKESRAQRTPLIGDAVFTSEQAEWLRAGRTKEEQRTARRLAREARIRIARARAEEPIEARLVRAEAEALRRRGRVRPSEVATLLIAEDVRGRKFERGTTEATTARAGYTALARERKTEALAA